MDGFLDFFLVDMTALLKNGQRSITAIIEISDVRQQHSAANVNRQIDGDTEILPIIHFFKTYPILQIDISFNEEIPYICLQESVLAIYPVSKLILFQELQVRILKLRLLGRSIKLLDSFVGTIYDVSIILFCILIK